MLLDGWRIPDADELEADALAKEEAELAAAEAERLAEEARLRSEHLEARVSVVNNATVAYNTGKTRLDSVQIDNVLKSLNDAMAQIENAEKAIAAAAAGEDVSAYEKEIAVAERTVRMLYETNIVAVYEAVERAYNTVLDKQRLLEESIEFFKTNGTYTEKFIALVEANVEPLMAVVADATAAMETIEDYREQVLAAAKGLIVVEEEKEEEIVEEFMPAKYKLDDGSIVAVTYGEVGAPYKTFLLNYNYFDIIVEFEGNNYEIGAYGYAEIKH